MNADPAELQKFSELAHRWWDPESEFKPLHQINPLRLDWIEAMLMGAIVILPIWLVTYLLLPPRT